MTASPGKSAPRSLRIIVLLQAWNLPMHGPAACMHVLQRKSYCDGVATLLVNFFRRSSYLVDSHAMQYSCSYSVEIINAVATLALQ